VRAPFSLQKLVCLDGQQAVLYRSRMNPSLGRNFEAMDPVEWLARAGTSSLSPRHRRRPRPGRAVAPDRSNRSFPPPHQPKPPSGPHIKTTIGHADAGYERAIEVARERGVKIPML
jgi:hypothetical protein